MNRKNSYSGPSQGNEKSAADNSQDWVCIKCNNLNFSFRKKCNRCKIQSRQDNQQIVYDYYYYNHYYTYQPHHHDKKGSFQASNPLDLAPKSPVRNSFESHSPKDNIGLPSVSPLLKKYKDSWPKKRIEALKTFWKGEPIQKLFGQQIWNAEQFQQVDLKSAQKQLSVTDDEQGKEQFIRSVQKMIV